MSKRERIEKRAEATERHHEEENLMLNKRQEEFKTIEEVFDRPTLQGVYKLFNQKVIGEIFGVIKAGKRPASTGVWILRGPI